MTLQSKRELERLAPRLAAEAARKDEQAALEAKRVAAEAARVLREGPLAPGEVRVVVEAADGTRAYYRATTPLSDVVLTGIADLAALMAVSAEDSQLARAEAQLASAATAKEAILARRAAAPEKKSNG